MIDPAARRPFEYSLLRVVPRVDRGETINAGVIIYCADVDFLAAGAHLDATRLRALDPNAEQTDVATALESIVQTCATAVADRGQLFRWLTAPRSTVVQPGPVHTGLTADPGAELKRLVQLLVLPVA